MDGSDFESNPRKLLKAFLDAIPDEEVRTSGELAPGGHLRQKNNTWIRGAYDAAGLRKVPRETRVRLVIQKLAKKKKLCISIAFR